MSEQTDDPLQQGRSLVDDRGVPGVPPIYSKVIEAPPDALLGDLEEVIQRYQKEGREQGCIWFRFRKVLIGVYRLEGWDRKPEGA